MPSPSEHPPWLESLVSKFSEEWKAGRSPSLDQALPADLAHRQLALVPLLRIDLQHRLEAKQPARVEDYLQRFPEIASRPDVLLSLLETETRVKNSLDPYATSPSLDDQVKRFPMLAERLLPPVDPHQTRPSDRPAKLVGVPSTEAKSRLPGKVGRYRVEKVLGQGGFGLVYLAHDDQLLRPVAIKLPHPERIRGPEDVEEYLTEAQTVTSLKHPHIVTVLDVGSTPEHPFFVVSEFIAGSTLDQRIRTNRPSLSETIDLVSIIAQTLHFAHKKGIVHRDIKPGNILLDETGKPYVADFGLALREQDVGKRKGIAGTPSYMSPEQARGEAHRVDGRSDLFSLGIVFYQMITGHLPFQGDSVADLLDLVINAEFKPPRQWDENIPREIERICIKALARRASERYSSCNDFAEDLAEYLQETSVGEKSILEMTRPATPPPAGPPPSTPIASPSTQPGSDSQPILRIVPKGLRSFDAHDADFFLDLLPGPRDRHGLPDSIRFWKQRIEEMDADKTFSVGLIYGPSGCGKSSLVKAGLLPRLANSILPVYLETTAEETEARLLKGLRKQCPLLPGNLDLIEGLKALQRGKYLPANQKVLLVIDQFEQWLHAHKEETKPELVQALRQCDGRHVQCIVMVRDDFWLAVSRFLRDLEIRLVEGHNSSLVDLFPLPHAEKVLAAFGKAFGLLPEAGSQVSREQKQFLQQALSGLAQEGKVISVRLALFAEMMKGKPWTPAALKAVGGTAGVGVTFLEETFSASSAPPEHRYHQKAARAVLQALLPESGTDIKGHMRSREDLLNASGYGNRPNDFADLLQILDGEIRLITPTDPEGTDLASGGHQPPDSNSQQYQRYFQLTHDYLVPSLRDWLTRKEKETPPGRARLLLADRAVVWTACSEARQLPSLLQWLQIRRLTDAKAWTSAQKTMMNKAKGYHLNRLMLATASLFLLSWFSYEIFGQVQANKLVEKVLIARPEDVPGIVQQMAYYRRWVNPLLQANHEHPHAKLALLPTDAGLFDSLYEQLLQTDDPEQLRVLRDALNDSAADKLVERLTGVVEQDKDAVIRFRAACALAGLNQESGETQKFLWAKAAPGVVEQLLQRVQKNPSHYAGLLDLLRNVKTNLNKPLGIVYRDLKRAESERNFATSILADYGAEDITPLTDLLLDGDARQFAVIFPVFQAKSQEGLPLLNQELAIKLLAEMPSSDDKREVLAKRQANAAVAMLRLHKPESVWPLLKHSPDPRVRSYLIHRLSPLGADAKAIVQQFDTESDVSIRRALLLALGEFSETEFSRDARAELIARVQQVYEKDPDSGLHTAGEWLLRNWKQEAWLAKTNRAWAARDDGKNDRHLVSRQWYVNSQGQTMVVRKGPVEFQMGTPQSESDRRSDEIQHRRRISRSFSLASKSVTLGEYRTLTKSEYDVGDKQYTHRLDLPVNGINWYMAAAYCNLLSKAEGIEKDQWCYKVDAKGQVTELKANYLHLSGYRLPTEAEMEYATRAGATTSRYYGETEELLSHYAWYTKNTGDRLQPVGLKKPNDWGFFDIQGNGFTWCQESYGQYGDATGVIPISLSLEDEEPKEIVIKSTVGRVLRGGTFDDRASLLRSGSRLNYVPTTRNDDLGIRPARTLLP